MEANISTPGPPDAKAVQRWIEDQAAEMKDNVILLQPAAID